MMFLTFGMYVHPPTITISSMAALLIFASSRALVTGGKSLSKKG